MSGEESGSHADSDRIDPVTQFKTLLEKDGKDVERAAFLTRIGKHSNLSADVISHLSTAALAGHCDFAGQVTAVLLRHEAGRRFAATQFAQEPTKTFEDVWRNGSNSTRAFVLEVVLQPKAWHAEEERTKAETDMVQLLLAKMLEPGVDDPQLALFSLARIIAVDVAKLEHLMDGYALDMMFVAFNHRHSADTRGQATLVIAKLFEVAPGRVEKELTRFVEEQIKTQKVSRLSLACSVVGQLFPVMPAIAAKMVLQERFLTSTMRLVDKSGSCIFREAVMNLLSAACMDRPCREAIRKQCGTWVWDHAQSINNDAADVRGINAQAVAAAVSAKIQTDDPSGNSSRDDLVLVLKRLIASDDASAKSIEEAIEALSYQSTHPAVKEKIVNDPVLFRKILSHLAKPSSGGMTMYAGLMVVFNLTRYPPVLSPEQQKLAELKAYADRSKVPQIDSLDKEEPVSGRCQKVLGADIGHVLIKAAKQASPTLLKIISQIILALSKHPRHRGTMAQQGLFDTSIAIASMDTNSPASSPSAKRNAALSVARILIPINPGLLFNKRPIQPVITALNYLLTVPLTSEDTRSDEQYWSGHPVVTALQGLSNIATLTSSLDSSDPDHAIESIASTCLASIDEHFESTSPAIRTAASELFVNLSQASAGYELFASATGSKSLHRFQILTAYFGDEDLKLRMAAGGTLATLLGSGEMQVVKRLLASKHGAEYTAEALVDKDNGMRARAVMIAWSIVQFLEHEGVDEVLIRKIKSAAKEHLVPTIPQMDKLAAPQGAERQYGILRRMLKSLEV